MPTITERLELLINAKTGGAVAEIRKLDAAFQKSGATQTQATGITARLQTGLESMGLSASLASTVLKTAVPLAAGAAGAAMLKLGRDSVNATVNLASSIRDVQRASGATADTASRLVAIFDDYNIAADSGTRGLAKFGVNLANNKTQLKDNGIEIAKNKDGTIDLVGSLENAADAYKNAGSAAERDKLILDAFGKSGRDLIPILEQGRAGIEKMFADVPQGQILSQEQVDAAKRYELAIDDLQDTLKELEVNVGNALIPLLTQAASTLATLSRTAQQVTDPVGGLSGVLEKLVFQANPLANAFGVAHGAAEVFHGEIRQGTEDMVRHVSIVGNEIADLGELVGVFKKGSTDVNAYAAAQKNAADAEKGLAALAAGGVATHEQLAEAKKKVTTANEALATVQGRVAQAFADTTPAADKAAEAESKVAAATQATVTAAQNAYDAVLALANAHLGLEGAELNVESATVAYNKAVEDGTADSLEARQAHNQLEGAVAATAKAAADAKEQQVALGGGTATTSEKLAAQRDELGRLKERFPELTPIIDAYLFQLGEIPASRTTTMYADTAPATIAIANYRAQLDALGRDVTTQIFAGIFGGVTRQHGGPIPGGANQAVPILAHGGEYVLSEDVVSRIKSGRPSRGAKVPGGDWPGGGTPAAAGSGPTTIQLVVSGRVLAEVTAAELSKAGGPQIASRAIAG